MKIIRSLLSFIADSIELLIQDLTCSKRSRRYAAKKRTYTRRKKTPVLVIKVVMES